MSKGVVTPVMVSVTQGKHEDLKNNSEHQRKAVPNRINNAIPRLPPLHLVGLLLLDQRYGLALPLPDVNKLAVL